MGKLQLPPSLLPPKQTIKMPFIHATPKCDHVWDGGWVEIDDHGGGSASCSKCGTTAFAVSMREAW